MIRIRSQAAVALRQEAALLELMVCRGSPKLGQPRSGGVERLGEARRDHPFATDRHQQANEMAQQALCVTLQPDLDKRP